MESCILVSTRTKDVLLWVSRLGTFCAFFFTAHERTYPLPFSLDSEFIIPSR
jgi:hypothetical protein